jgi:demethylmenaquinone methyltransferase/2-methoxy-6-polyprenyl-1,4-benzoquinol methylase
MSKGIQNIFSEVSNTYEIVNHALTLGLDILWRRKAARVAANGGGERWIDICTGTSEMAVYLNRLTGKDTRVFAADFSMEMIREAAMKGGTRQIRFTLADASHLPFPNETFDLVTISFATRNINVSKKILLERFREFHRILKPGGRFVNLETSQPPSWFVRRIFHLYVRLAVKRLGSRISGSKSGYAYLANTIPRFYNAMELADTVRQAGFTKVIIHPMLFGAAAIHKALK